MNQHREFKNLLYEQFARIGKAVSSPHRLELIDLLAQGERSVEELARESAMPIANASQHLQALRRAQLVEVRREGQYAYYRLADGQVFRLWQALRDLGEQRLAEIDRLVQIYLSDRQDLESIDAATLLARLHDDEITLLDVRPVEEFRAGHLPGARSIPVAELARRVAELPAGREVIAYCRGPWCLYADEAVALLRAGGFTARRLDTGFPDWRSEGFPVETS